MIAAATAAVAAVTAIFTIEKADHDFCWDQALQPESKL